MTLSIQTVGRRVAENLANAEDLANQTLMAYAKLMQSMMEVRTKTDVGPYEGQIAVTRLQAAMSKIVEAQGDTVKAHKLLRTDFCKITMIPDDGTRCPTEPFVEAVKDAA